jgi:hypothetical protein
MAISFGKSSSRSERKRHPLRSWYYTGFYLFVFFVCTAPFERWRIGATGFSYVHVMCLIALMCCFVQLAIFALAQYISALKASRKAGLRGLRCVRFAFWYAQRAIRPEVYARVENQHFQYLIDKP